MKKLLKLDRNNRWDLEGITFAIEERVGEPENFIGRIKELEFLYNWAHNIRKKISRSIAFLGRRKIGKSLILERLYNEKKGLIPFYYEFTECKNYAPENIYKINQKMVEDFAGKARQLATERFQQKELRLCYFSKNGFEEKMKPVFDRQGIYFDS